MSEFDVLRVGSAVSSLDAPTELAGYSKVIITVTDELAYEAGTEEGRTLTVDCPWGTQTMADELLERVKGISYQPYSASGAVVDPAAEIGDAVSLAGDVYGGVYSKQITYGATVRADLGAPHTEEVNEVVAYKSPESRKVTRQFKSVNSQLKIQADQIAAEVEAREADGATFRAELVEQATEISAKVSQSGGDSKSFSWSLTADGWSLHANGSEVLSADKDGLKVSGEIRATSGSIGGFTIKDGYLSTNNQTWGGTNTTGIYIGSNGIQLGKNFKVDSAGNLTAASGTFTGAVSAGSIQYGGSDGYFDGGGLTGGSVTGTEIANSTLNTTKLTGGVRQSLGNGDYSYDVVTGSQTASMINATYAKMKTLEVSKLVQYNTSNSFTVKTITYLNGDGTKSVMKVFAQ